MEQASAVATEVTSSIMRLKLEVEEKKRAVSLLQTALVRQPHAPAAGKPRPRSLMFLGAVASKCEIRALCPRSSAGLLGGVRRRWAGGSWAAAVPVPLAGERSAGPIPLSWGLRSGFSLLPPGLKTSLSAHPRSGPGWALSRVPRGCRCSH